MKEIKAIVRPHMLNKVMDALHKLPHFPGVTVNECRGQGRGRGIGGQFQATQESIFFEKMIKLEIVCADAACGELLEVIQKAAYTGNIGDGVVMVVELPRVVRIRTGEQQEKAV